MDLETIREEFPRYCLRKAQEVEQRQGVKHRHARPLAEVDLANLDYRESEFRRIAEGWDEAQKDAKRRGLSFLDAMIRSARRDPAPGVYVLTALVDPLVAKHRFNEFLEELEQSGRLLPAERVAITLSLRGTIP